MGYRIRLGKVPKSKKEEMSSITQEMYSNHYNEENDEYLLWYSKAFGEDCAPYRPEWHTELYELGKYVEYPQHRLPFYNFKLDDSEFDILTKEGLKAIIEEFRNDVHEHYKSVLNAAMDREYNKVAEQGVIAHLQSHVWEWEGKYFNPYYLDEPKENKDGALVRSWKKEYCIFNLVYIYQHFDWENDYLIISGW